MLKSFFARFGSGREQQDHAHALYGAVVAHARDPQFFARHGVPDTFDGRFEMLVIHLFLIHERLKDEPVEARAISQNVFDLFIDDMDAALREAGVGDQTVPKRIAKMTQVFYGRTGAFEAALAADDAQAELASAIERNLFADMEANGHHEGLAAYLKAQYDHLRQKPWEQVAKAGDPFLKQAQAA
ncbi:MAG: ubiquinol-cytochrome C chaperone family protein [Pseudomonadota bacterium]